MKRFLPSHAFRLEAPEPADAPPGGRRRGVILVMTLWIIIVLSLVAFSLGYEMQMEMRLTTLRRDSLVAYELARIGLARGVVDLKNDLIMDFEPDETNPSGQPFDGPGDVWRIAEDKTDVKVGANGRYSVSVTDEESRLSLHSLRPTQLELMKRILMTIGERERDAEEMAQVYFDYIDPDDIPIGGEGSSEVEFYAERFLRRVGRDALDLPPFRPKNDWLILPDELLMIPGFTPERFYGYDPLDPRETQKRQERLASGREAPLGLRDMVTAFSSGELNINTASVETMTALFAAITRNQTEGRKMAEEVVRRREGASRRRPDNDRAFRSRDELAAALGESGAMVMQASGAYHPINVVSHNFTIEGVGTILDDQGEPRVSRRLAILVGREWQTFPLHDGSGFDNRRSRRQGRDQIERSLERRHGLDRDEPGVISIPILRAMRWIEN